MKTVFFGNHLYGHHALFVMLEAGFVPDLVLANVPREGERVWYPSVAELAANHGIPIIKANKVAGDTELRERIRKISPDLFVVASFRNILDAELLAIPRRGAINLHMAPLPMYRGAHPENWAIINGEREMGYTVHFLDEGIDTGDIIDQAAVPILPEDNILSLTFKLAHAAPSLLVDVLWRLKEDRITRTPQRESEASFYPPRKPSDGLIDWSQGSKNIHNLVRALARPYPGAFTFLDGRKLTVWSLRANGGGTCNASPGTILEISSQGILVETGDKPVYLTEYDCEGDRLIQVFEGRVLGS